MGDTCPLCFISRLSFSFLFMVSPWWALAVGFLAAFEPPPSHSIWALSARGHRASSGGGQASGAGLEAQGPRLEALAASGNSGLQLGNRIILFTLIISLGWLVWWCHYRKHWLGQTTFRALELNGQPVIENLVSPTTPPASTVSSLASSKSSGPLWSPTTEGWPLWRLTSQRSRC